MQDDHFEEVGKVVPIRSALWSWKLFRIQSKTGIPVHFRLMQSEARKPESEFEFSQASLRCQILFQCFEGLKSYGGRGESSIWEIESNAATEEPEEPKQKEVDSSSTTVSPKHSQKPKLQRLWEEM